MPQIKAAGGNLVAVSVENPDNSLKVSKKNELDFTVLSDPNLTTRAKFGIVYQMPKETDELYKSKYSLDIAKHNEMERRNCRSRQLMWSTERRNRLRIS
jgi:peroxiredoxin